MFITTPGLRAQLLMRYPALADHGRPAIRLHPRRGRPRAADSSVGGPLQWPQDEPWPTCTADHAFPEPEPSPMTEAEVRADLRRMAAGKPRQDQDYLLDIDPAAADFVDQMLDLLDSAAGQRPPTRADEPRPEPPGRVVMAPVLQVYRRDLEVEGLELPEFMFPDGTDLLQILWCPNPHLDTYEPRVRHFWRSQALLGPTVEAMPVLNHFTRDEEVDFTPRSCLVHPEIVFDFPRIRGDECPDYESWLSDNRLAVAPGWKLGGWMPPAHGDEALRKATCACGAPTWLLLSAATECLSGPWLPQSDPDFPWTDPGADDPENPTGVWGGRNGPLWLHACSAHPEHPVVSESD